MPAPYQPGRDDTKFGRLARELHAETAAYLAAAAHHPDLARSAELNEQLAGKWAVWFEATGPRIRWLGRSHRTGALLAAPSPEELVAKIEEEDT
jgi:hypothetical protein